ncbi:MAG: hypothetical protein FKY71_10580 [Spiribacter salinus]|uniref:Helix-turn-helix domain-containing protein n=1 Tax=Spiribacter salinus TaxID=1335746 RepID=A0A540VQX0_9GAMM|nr:MAG: hypothetical protein FKY71_10580 [Spiribacter salinus]
MAGGKQRYQKRRNKHTFAGIPHDVLKTEKYASLSGWAVKLLVDVVAQYTGRNNGDLQASWSCMQKVGWRSKGTLASATTELLEAGFLVKTRQGGRNHCSLYAITWEPIHHCPDKRTKQHKLDVNPTNVAPGTWKDEPTARRIA